MNLSKMLHCPFVEPKFRHASIIGRLAIASRRVTRAILFSYYYLVVRALLTVVMGSSRITCPLTSTSDHEGAGYRTNIYPPIGVLYRAHENKLLWTRVQCTSCLLPTAGRLLSVSFDRLNDSGSRLWRFTLSLIHCRLTLYKRTNRFLFH